MELEDIVLQQGDIVYFTDETWHIDSADNGKKFFEIFEYCSSNDVVRIERPKTQEYETIYKTQNKSKIQELEDKIYELDYKLTALTDFIYNYFYNHYGLVSDEEFDKLKGLL